ncbi:hypothetical protein D3C79_940070 [compost metagenome]
MLLADAQGMDGPVQCLVRQLQFSEQAASLLFWSAVQTGLLLWGEAECSSDIVQYG